MATLIDERLDDNEEETNFYQEPDDKANLEEEEEIPEKYQGKSVADIVRMHQEAEKLLGRQSSEVGELRSVVDSYIKTQLDTKPAPEPDEEIDFFSDPDKAVERAISKHPKIREAEEVTNQYRKSTALGQLQQRHPDMQEVLQDTKFGEWVNASKIRKQLFEQADKQYDYEAADELFTNWKERQGVVSQTAATEKAERKAAVKTASTGNTKGSGEQQSRKVYRRADIIKLMKDDPERYMSLSDEIILAYKEGRVRN